MEFIIGLIALIAIILMIRKVGVIEPNRNVASNIQLSQDIPQHIPTTQNTPQNMLPQNNSNVLNDVTKAGLIGTAAGLGLIGAGMLLNRNNYYNYYYNPYEKPDTALAEHLHDLIWNDGCCKCDNDVIYNTFSSCDDTNFLDDSSCSWNDDSSCNNSWDFGYDDNSYNDD
ncbi:MAG: ABC transporter substrate-binding protein, partial [Sulfurihydrogenibium sp.]|nr:ABC transporter substrate-binding protein [Sulfurihydrogenibium sp.]